LSTDSVVVVVVAADDNNTKIDNKTIAANIIEYTKLPIAIEQCE
jgi:hypothetical protein